MKKVKKNISIGMILLASVTMLAGCNSKVIKNEEAFKQVMTTVDEHTKEIVPGQAKLTADESAKILFDFEVKSDKSNIIKFGWSDYSYSDKTKQMEKEAFNLGLKSSISSSGLQVSDQQIDSIYDALQNALKKLNETTSIVSKDDNSAQVKIKTTYIDLKGIISKAQQQAIDDVKSSGATSEADLKNKLLDAYIKEIDNDLNNAAPSSDTREDTYKFIKKENHWVPENSNEFSKGLSNLAYMQ